jgi:hypothetical protein
MDYPNFYPEFDELPLEWADGISDGGPGPGWVNEFIVSTYYVIYVLTVSVEPKYGPILGPVHYDLN